MSKPIKIKATLESPAKGPIAFLGTHVVERQPVILEIDPYELHRALLKARPDLRHDEACRPPDKVIYQGTTIQTPEEKGAADALHQALNDAPPTEVVIRPRRDLVGRYLDDHGEPIVPGREYTQWIEGIKPDGTPFKEALQICTAGEEGVGITPEGYTTRPDWRKFIPTETADDPPPEPEEPADV